MISLATGSKVLFEVMPNTRVVIISVTSDIGLALASHWQKKGFDIYGTYRKSTSKLLEIGEKGGTFVHCDLSDQESIRIACQELLSFDFTWDVLVMCPGTMLPIGRFTDIDYQKWRQSIEVNFTAQLELIHTLLPFRNRENQLGPLVLTFAGGGTNNATSNYSAYTISKIALIKMMELLDAEIQDTRFSIVGPGWVKTKIHQETLRAGDKAGTNLSATEAKLADDKCTDVQHVLKFCDWIATASRDVIGGRNFSLVHDQWGSVELDEFLKKEKDAYKLRRSGNSVHV
jgi:NAD(P)-dependent dehydrogenase (short-subunit alcohol dehydrogenase family)